MVGFKKAVKAESKLRMALVGPSGSGKTYSALAIGSHLGERVAVIDTERGSASKYADLFPFDVLELDSFHPQNYVAAIHEAEDAGYDVLIIDSLSHAWSGKDGALELVDRAAKSDKSQNSFNAWRSVTPLQNALIDAIIGAKLHVIATMRAKTEYVVETNERGRSAPRKVGMAPIQRNEIEFEFDVVGNMNHDNELIVDKTRCPALTGGVYPKPGEDVATILKQWLAGVKTITGLQDQRIRSWAKANPQNQNRVTLYLNQAHIRRLSELTESQAADMIAALEIPLKEQPAEALQQQHA